MLPIRWQPILLCPNKNDNKLIVSLVQMTTEMGTKDDCSAEKQEKVL